MKDTVTFHAHGAIASSVLKGSSEMDMTYHPIGIIHSPFTSLEAMPIQPVGATSGQGIVEIFAEFADGLKDLDGFSYLIYSIIFIRRIAARLLSLLFSTPRLTAFSLLAPRRALIRLVCLS